MPPPFNLLEHPIMFCGLDFGTSNSTIGIASAEKCRLVPLEKDTIPLRSAIFCDNEAKRWVFGQAGIDSYLESIPGRLMMSLKSVLGSPLMNDETLIFNEMIPYAKVLEHFIKHIKLIAENEAQQEITQVVLGRPVHFHDNDKAKDILAQQTLEQIAKEAGFSEIEFQFEPIAAAITYEMSVQEEQLALIVDIGGGTSDFTVVRLYPGYKSAMRSEDVLANEGIHIAGTDFDQRLSLSTVMPLLGMHSLTKGFSHDLEMPSAYYYDLTTWHTLHTLYKPTTITQIKHLQNKAYQKELIARLLRVLQRKAGHFLLDSIETCKKELSESDKLSLDLNYIETDLSLTIERSTLNTAIEVQLSKIINTIKETINIAGTSPENIDAIFYTGGSTKIPVVRQSISSLFPNAKIIEGDAFGSVGLGLTIDAQRRFQR